LNALLAQHSGVEKALEQQRLLVRSLERKFTMKGDEQSRSASLKDEVMVEGREEVDAAESPFITKIIHTYAKEARFKDKTKTPSKISSIKKLIKEKMLIDAARDELDKEAELIRSKQTTLSRVKDLWRQQSRSKGNSSQTRDELRERSQSINRKASALNSRVEAVKRMRKWIDERQRKLDALERAMTAGSSSVDSYGSPSEAEMDGMGLLDKLTQELDDDVSVLDASSVPSSTPGDFYDKIHRTRPSSHRKYKSAAYPTYAASNSREPRYAQPPVYPPNYYYDMQTRPQTFYQLHPPPPAPGMYFSEDISDALSKFSQGINGPRYPHWTAPLRNEENSTELHNMQYPNQEIKRRAASHENKRQLQEITNRITSSKELYENHAKY
jgi:hypothetical protein